MSETIRKLDEELVAIISGFLILGPLSWPKEAMRSFLKGVAKDQFTLPEFDYPKVDYRDKISRLKAYIKKLGVDEHPAIAYLRETAESYIYAYTILQGAGTKQVTEFSRRLYGSPTDNVLGYQRRSVDIALYLLRIAEEYKAYNEDEPLIYSAAELRQQLQRKVHRTIPKEKDPIHITIDNKITARASAGPNYVKIRKGSRFSQADLAQLLHHEVMVHTLTYINGRKQPLLRNLGYSAPRTTATQEGLAVFSEYINGSLELVRLKRIALRILAIRMAEQGADLVDLFKFYRRHSQDDEESYYSAMRILRGGSPKGGIVFYKDNVYLSGLIEISNFLKRTMHEGKLQHIELLFCGKLTTQDLVRLKPLIEAGQVERPCYLPAWVNKRGELAAHLAFNDLSERFGISHPEPQTMPLAL